MLRSLLTNLAVLVVTRGNRLDGRLKGGMEGTYNGSSNPDLEGYNGNATGDRIRRLRGGHDKTSWRNNRF